MKIEILKSEMQSGNTLIAAATQAFSVKNSARDIRTNALLGTVEIYTGGEWVAYDAIVSSDKFTFLTAV